MIPEELPERSHGSTAEATATEPAPATQPAAAPQPAPAAPVVPHVAATSDADKTVGFRRAMKVRAKQFAEESAALDRKFNPVDLGTVLVTQNLVCKAGNLEPTTRAP